MESREDLILRFEEIKRHQKRLLVELIQLRSVLPDNCIHRHEPPTDINQLQDQIRRLEWDIRVLAWNLRHS